MTIKWNDLDKNEHPKALLVFSKVPRRGLVKTRLAEQVGEDEAFTCFCKLFGLALTEGAAAAASRFLYLFPPDWQERELHPWAGLLSAYAVRPQRGQDLGARMAQAFAESFKEGFRGVVIVGTDIPKLTRAVIEAALTALDTHDLVLGPTEDGGYYLLGLRAGHEGWRTLFEGISWGAPDVLSQTLERAETLGLETFLLPVLFDVDNKHDLARWLTTPVA